MSNFQIALVTIFLIIFGFAILVFSGIINLGSSKNNAAQGTVVIWGTVSSQVMNEYVTDFARQDDGFTMTYVQKEKNTIEQEFIEALASGAGPDLLLLESDTYFRQRDKFYTIPYTNYPLRTFQDTYIDGASVFVTKDGISGIPAAVDPLVLYYNKDILAKAGLITPPTTWEDISKLVPLLVKKDRQNALDQTALPLGEAANIEHFKEILSLLILQTGNNIVVEDPLTNSFVSTLDFTELENSGASDALQFYISFANPVNELYSWNRSLPEALDYFLASKSAFYLGKSSELFTIQERNPNLNFDVTAAPQPTTATRPVNFGTYTAAFIVKSSKNFVTAYTAALQLGGEEFSTFLSTRLSVPPVHRTLIVNKPLDPYLNVFFSTAQSAFTWPDPSKSGTDKAFRDMITNVSSGRMSPEESVYEASKAIGSLIRR